MHLRLLPLLLAAASAPLMAQETPAAASVPAAAPATPAPAPAKEAGPDPIPLADVLTRADALERAQSGASGVAFSDKDEIAIRRRAREIDALQANTAQSARPGGALESLRELEIRWQELEKEIEASTKDLTARANLLDKRIALLPAQKETWEKTLESARGAGAPDGIRWRVGEALEMISRSAAVLEKERAAILSAQSRVAGQGRKVSDSLASLHAARNAAMAGLFEADLPPLWSPESWENGVAGWLNVRHGVMAAQLGQLAELVRTSWLKFVLVILGGGAIAAFLIWIKRLTAGVAEEDPALRHSTPVLESPYATAAVLMLFPIPAIFGFQPWLFWAILSLAALFPILRLLRRLLDPGLFPILYALVAFTLIAQFRKLPIVAPELSRLLLMLEVAGGTIFIVWFLRANPVKPGEAAWWKVARISMSLARVLFAVIFLALIQGYFHLADFLGAGSLSAGYAGILLYAVVVIVRGLTFFALRVHPLADLRAVRLHRPQIQRRADRILYFVATCVWGVTVLELFMLKEPVFSWVTAVLNAETNFKSLHISLGAVLAFALTLWVALMFSRFVRFVLEEDIYHRFKVASGPSYAVSTLLHYVILMVGFFMAIAALGADMTKFAVLAGAMGVGIGLGLQNIFSNFVSGIILLFERPVNVGDVVQVADATGVIRRIGIRASVIRIANSSELIVPNSMLISEKVTNWTLSNRQRRIELPVGVDYGSDARQVIELLKSVAAGHPMAAKYPPAEALMLGFAPDSLSFEVRVWTNEFDQGGQIRSDIAVAVNDALAAAGIGISYPQRDLHLRSVDPAVVESLRQAAGGPPPSPETP